MAAARLEDLVNSTKDLFLEAKADGKLDVAEVVQIGVHVAAKLEAAQASLGGADKKALVLYALQKGLEVSGGVPGMTAEGEKQLLAAAAAAVDVAVSVARGKIDLRKKEGWMACLPLCVQAVKAGSSLLPKDVAVLKEALLVAAGAGPGAATSTQESSKSAATLPLKDPPPVKGGIAPETPCKMEPNPLQLPAIPEESSPSLKAE